MAAATTPNVIVLSRIAVLFLEFVSFMVSPVLMDLFVLIFVVSALSRSNARPEPNADERLRRCNDSSSSLSRY
jgi:Na+/H+ antiporter NhaD/arsenite permease-like protein